MVNLDDFQQVKRLDASNVYDSVEQLAKQCSHAWEDAGKISVPDDYKKIDKIIMTGMGGSGLGARIIESVYGLGLKYPLIRLNDYDLPDWVDEKTLVICSTFSGTTEETIQNANQAEAKKAKWMAIASGSQLIELAKKAGVPYYQIVPTYNPSKQPRLAVGYSVIGQLIMVSKSGAFDFAKKEIELLTAAMKKVVEANNINVPIKNNQAKQIANKLFQKKIAFVASRHLVGAVHTTNNQSNENSKNFSTQFDIPELNHHLMEGLRYPDSNKKDLIFFFVESDLYPERIKKRYGITEDVVKKNQVEFVVYKPQATDHLSQVFEFLQFGGYVSFYLAMLNGLDPAAIPWVDYFKIKLGQSLGTWR